MNIKLLEQLKSANRARNCLLSLCAAVFVLSLALAVIAPLRSVIIQAAGIALHKTLSSGHWHKVISVCAICSMIVSFLFLPPLCLTQEVHISKKRTIALISVILFLILCNFSSILGSVCITSSFYLAVAVCLITGGGGTE